MLFVYVLLSETAGPTIHGQTQDVTARLLRPNRGISRSTPHGIPGQLVYLEAFGTGTQVMLRERLRKTGAGRDELQRLSGWLSGQYLLREVENLSHPHVKFCWMRP